MTSNGAEPVGPGEPGEGPPRPADAPAGSPRNAPAEGEWQRVHPLTPLIRSWSVIVVGIVVIGHSFGNDLLRTGSDPNEWREAADEVPPLVFLLIGLAILAGVAVLLLCAWLSWRATRYRVTADTLEMYRGIVYRQHRAAPLDRLQAVDVVQPLLARIVGLAQLTLEVAGGGDSKIALSYLGDERARDLRNRLLARAAGVRYETQAAPEAPQHPVLEVPVPRLIAATALSGPALVVGVALVGAVGLSIASGSIAGGGAVLVPALFGAGQAAWVTFSRGFGFSVAVSPDGVRLRHGLLEHRAQTLPPGRVQAIRLQQPLLWRPFDWWRVNLNVAGYSTSGNEALSENVLLPVGSRDDALRVAALVVPDLGDTGGEDPADVVRFGMGDAAGTGAGWSCPPRAARWLDPVSWSRTATRSTGLTQLVRLGRFTRTLVIVPHAKVQSIGSVRGPVQRRLGLATVVLHSTPGPVKPRIPHLDAAAAARLVAEEARRARAARGEALPERWMENAPRP